MVVVAARIGGHATFAVGNKGLGHDAIASIFKILVAEKVFAAEGVVERVLATSCVFLALER